MSRASESMDERLRKMNDQASTLDKRLRGRVNRRVAYVPSGSQKAIQSL